MLCPCGSGLELEDCCGPVIDGAVASTPEALMRSRYSAYVRGDAAYLSATWAEATRPPPLDLSDPPHWRGLQVLDASQDGDHGEVEFIARFQDGGRVLCLHERSRFVRADGFQDLGFAAILHETPRGQTANRRTAEFRRMESLAQRQRLRGV